jgi:hypothetical protein
MIVEESGLPRAVLEDERTARVARGGGGGGGGRADGQGEFADSELYIIEVGRDRA